MSSKLTYTNNLTLISLSSLPCDNKVFATVLEACAKQGINLDMISQTARKGGSLNMSLTLSDDDLGDVLTVLGDLRSHNINIKPEILPSTCKVNYFDTGMVNTPGVAAKVFTALSAADVEVMLVTTSDSDISVLVPAHWQDEAVKVLAEVTGLTPEEVTL